MDTTLILDFLSAVAANNNRPWFQAHKGMYEKAKAEFEAGVAEAIHALAAFDSEIAQLTPKDCCYRFYRDIRFSADKSPYKRHFGAYICAHGKKALRGGYYIHMQPGHCLMAVGSWWLPTNILASVRNEIMGNIDEWRSRVESGKFVNTFGYPGEGHWDEDGNVSPKGFGIGMLKKAPKDFPRDYPYLTYLKMKDYCAWRTLPDDFFAAKDWAQRLAGLAKVAKPMMDFTNSVVDDYE